MFRKIRRKDREISIDAAKQLLKNERRGVLAVNGDDGYPYAVPLNYYYDEQRQKIYFHGSAEGHKADAIRACDKVCFTVYGNISIKKEAWAPYVQSAVVFGRCRMLEYSAESMSYLKMIAMKYYPDESLADSGVASGGKNTQIYEIDIEHISGKEIQEK
jgi:uncharacterized protein